MFREEEEIYVVDELISRWFLIGERSRRDVKKEKKRKEKIDP